MPDHSSLLSCPITNPWTALGIITGCFLGTELLATYAADIAAWRLTAFEVEATLMRTRAVRATLYGITVLALLAPSEHFDRPVRVSLGFALPFPFVFLYLWVCAFGDLNPENFLFTTTLFGCSLAMILGATSK